MDDQPPKPPPQLPPYRIRLKPPMTDEEQAEHDRQYQQRIAAALRNYSNEEINIWLAESEAKKRAAAPSSFTAENLQAPTRKQQLLNSLPPEQRALAEFLANHIARQLLAERDEEDKKLMAKKEKRNSDHKK